MARPLRVLALLSGVGALSLSPSASVGVRRLASRGAGQAWTGPSRVQRDRPSYRATRPGDEMPDLEDEEEEEAEEKLQALDDEVRKRRKAVKYHIMRRKMTPPGPPPRMLTWDAMEQIRYLKREQPEEWTVERLAESFNVTPDVIGRVLRSKFVPAAERKAKQDNVAMHGLHGRTLPSGAGKDRDRLQLPGKPAPAALPAGGGDAALVPVSRQALTVGGGGSGPPAKTLLPPPPPPAAAMQTQLSAGSVNDGPVARLTEEHGADKASSPEDKEGEEGEEDEERWDGLVFTEEDLEEFVDLEKSPAVRVGKDFVDAKGHFLFRI